MNLAADLSLSSETLPFSDSLSDSHVSRIRFVPILPLSQGTLPLFRVWSTDIEAAVEKIDEDPAVESLTLLNVSDGAGLVRVEWTSDGLAWLRDGVRRTEVVLLGATATSNRWSLRICAETEEDLSAFQNHCRGSGLDTNLTKVTTLPEATGTEKVTPAQQEALLLAVDQGYFAEPRKVKLDELGEQAGISRQAFAGRLRRGIRNLVGETLESPGNG